VVHESFSRLPSLNTNFIINQEPNITQRHSPSFIVIFVTKCDFRRYPQVIILSAGQETGAQQSQESGAQQALRVGKPGKIGPPQTPHKIILRITPGGAQGTILGKVTGAFVADAFIKRNRSIDGFDHIQ